MSISKGKAASFFKSSSSHPKDEIKIQYNIKINRVEGLGKNVSSGTSLFVTWKRGKKAENQGESKRVPHKDGVAVFEQPITLQASLLKDNKGYSSKKIKFTLTEEKEKDKGKKSTSSLGSIEVDLSQFAESKTERTRTFPLNEKSKVAMNLYLSFQANVLKMNGKSLVKAENDMQKEIYSSMGKQQVNHGGEEYFLKTEHDMSEPDETDFTPSNVNNTGDDGSDGEEEVSFEDDHHLASTTSTSSMTSTTSTADKSSISTSSFNTVLHTSTSTSTPPPPLASIARKDSNLSNSSSHSEQSNTSTSAKKITEPTAVAPSTPASSESRLSSLLQSPLSLVSSDAKVKKYKKKIKTLKTSVDSLTKERDQKVDDIKQMLHEMETIREKSRTVGNQAVQQYTTEIDNLKTQLDKLTRVNKEIGDQLHLEKNQNTKGMNDIAKLQNQVITITSSFEKEQAEKQKLLKQIQELEVTSGEALENVRLNEQLEKSMSQYDKLQAEMDQVRQTLTETQEENRRIFVTLENERLKLNTTEGNNSRLDQENKNLKEQLEHSEKSKLVHSEELDKFNLQEAELNAARERLKVVDENIESYESKIKELNSNIQELTEKLSSAEGDESKLRELEQRNKDAISELNEEYDNKIKELQLNIKDLTELLEQSKLSQESIDQAHKLELEKEKQEITDQYNQQIQDLNNTIQQLNQSVQELESGKVNDEQQQHSSTMEQLKELEKQHQLETEKLNREYDQKIEHLILKHQTEINDLNSIHETKQQDHNNQLESEKQSNQQLVDNLNQIIQQLESDKSKLLLNQQEEEESAKQHEKHGDQEIIALKEQVKELQEQVSETQQLNEKIQELQDEVESLNEKVIKTKGKSTQLKEKSKSKSAEIEKYKDELDELNENYSQLLIIKEKLEQQNKNLNDDQEGGREGLTKSAIQDELDSLKSKSKYQQQEIHIYKEEISDYKEQLESYKQEVQRKDQKIHDVESQVNELKYKIKDVDGQKDKLTEALLMAEEKIIDLKSQLKEMEEAEARRRNDSSDEETQDELREKIQKYKEKIKGLKEELEEKEDEMAEDKVKFDELTLELENVTKDLVLEREKKSPVVVPVPIVHDNNISNEVELEDLKQQVKVLKQERDNERQSNLQLKEQINVIGIKYNDLQNATTASSSKSNSPKSPSYAESLETNNIKKELDDLKVIESTIYWTDLDFDRNNIPFCTTAVWQVITQTGGLGKNHSLLTKIVNALEKSFTRSGDDCKLICYWFSSAVNLLHKIHSSALIPKSADPIANGIEVDQDSFVLTSPEHGGTFIRDIQNLTLNIYSKLLSIIQSKLEKVLVPAIFVQNSNLFNEMKSLTNGTTKQFNSQGVSINNIILILDSILFFLDEGKVCNVISNQLLNQTFYFINSQITNHFLSNASMCRASLAFQVKLNISKLTEWCSSKHNSAYKQLDSSLEAANLFVVEKSVFSDIEAIKEIFQKLNLYQIRKLLDSYKPDDLSPDPLPSTLTQAMENNWRQPLQQNLPLLIDTNVKLRGGQDD